MHKLRSLRRSFLHFQDVNYVNYLEKNCQPWENLSSEINSSILRNYLYHSARIEGGIKKANWQWLAVLITYHLWRHHSNQRRKLHSSCHQCCADSRYRLLSWDDRTKRGYYSDMVCTLGIPSYVEGKGYTDDRRP